MSLELVPFALQFCFFIFLLSSFHTLLRLQPQRRDGAPKDRSGQ